MAQLSSAENPPAMWETWARSLAGLGRSPGEGKGYPLQYSGLENSMGCTVHGVAKSDTTEQLSVFKPLTNLVNPHLGKEAIAFLAGL